METASPVLADRSNRSADFARRMLRILSPVLAVVVALSLGSVLMLALRINPLQAYWAIVKGAFGSQYAFSETLVKTIPLLIIGLGITVAYSAHMWNIGAEGQLLFGGIAAAGIGIFLPPMPPFLHIALAILGGFLAGALWGGLPGFLKVTFGLNEVIVTLMLNYIAIEIVSYLVNGPWKDPLAVEPYTSSIAASAILPVLFPRTRLHAGLIIAIALVLVVHFVLYYTVFGYELRVTGASRKAARYAGIKVNRILFLSMAISGGIAGVAGFVEIAGLHHRLLSSISPGYGYTAIVVALLGRLTPFGTTLSAILFAALVVGADSMQRAVGAPSALVYVIQGLVILSVLVTDRLVSKA